MTSAHAAVDAATIDIAAVQAALAADGLDAWLLYDFRGINPIAADVTAVARQGGHLATRRWYYLIPVAGEPRALVHAIERHSLAHLPGTTERYSRRDQLESGLRRLLSGVRRVAMEYSPNCSIPYVSRVDAGTIELVRSGGAEVVSSGDLVQRFAAVWSAAAITSHLQASDKLYRVKDRAFAAIAQRTRDGVATTEYDIQQLMAGYFRDEGLVSDSDPNVSAVENAGNPHYLPTKSTARAIGRDELVLLDLWGKLDQPGAVFADITWMGFTGRTPPERYAKAFAAIAAARDAAVALVQRAAAGGQELRGWQVDRAASSVLQSAGYGDHILHRTGHSLGESVHGNGVNMDDFETHDDRRLLPGTGFTIEPGVYFDDFGVRTEINMIVHARDAAVSGALQTEILALL
ncbi:MAG TPA: M24 family metallopeptidase [Vicinamibacterales bacterium]|jgi:Xaa-Pro aminopeptidase|nr:M24 family metallopeptidase [Vicinamibacterales bacterium]